MLNKSMCVGTRGRGRRYNCLAHVDIILSFSSVVARQLFQSVFEQQARFMMGRWGGEEHRFVTAVVIRVIVCKRYCYMAAKPYNDSN